MPKSRGRKRIKKQHPQQKVQQVPPDRSQPKPPFWKRIVGFLVVLSALAYLGDLAHDQYGKTFPDISAKEADAGSRKPPAFIVKNVSPYFWMTNVQLICGIDLAAFDIGASGPIGFAIPVTTGIFNPPIRANKSVEYACNPGTYLKFENGKISLLGMTTASPIQGATRSDARLIQAEVWIGVKYRIFWITEERGFVSPKWRYQSANNSWEEIREIYK